MKGKYCTLFAFFGQPFPKQLEILSVKYQSVQK